MVTTEEIEKAKQTFPKFTVYVCYRGGETTAKTGEWYAAFGKDYNYCTEALKRAKEGKFKERQDEDLFNIVRKQELSLEEYSDFGNFIARLRDIGYEIDNLLNDYYNYEEKIMEIEKVEQNLKEVKRTERGWAGHFCCSSSCKFRRNTLLECGDIKIVVSTIGAMYLNGKIEEIGLNRHYETMAFHVDPKSGDYKDADFSREIFFESNGALKWHKKGYIDNEANEMHEAVVKEISDNLAKGWLYED